MNNPDRSGERSALYFMIGNLDLTNDDISIINNANWIPFCVKSVDRSRTFNSREVMDRCNPEEIGYSIGRSDTGLSFELNQFRWSLGGLVAFNNAVSQRLVVTVLSLNGQREDSDSWGWVGNFHISEQSATEPEDGLNTESYSLVPSAQGITRWIYGLDYAIASVNSFSSGFSAGFAIA